MKKLFYLAAFLMFSNFITGQTYPCLPTTVFYNSNSLCPNANLPYKLVYFDEFNGNSINSNDWYTYYLDGTTNNGTSATSRTKSGELENYLDQNVLVSNGKVTLVAKNEPNTTNGITKTYSSGLIYSKKIFNTYSKYEIRCKIPTGLGMWPAFWMFGWSTELDAFDNFGTTSQLKCGIVKWGCTNCCTNCGTSPHCNNGATINTIDLSAAFHTYTLEYEPFFIKFYLDGNMVRQITRYYDLTGNPMTNCSISPNTYLQEQTFPIEGDPLNIIANLAIGGVAPTPNGSLPFPQKFEIDYIKVWQKIPQTGLIDLCAREIVGDASICDNTDRTYTFNNLTNTNYTFTVSNNITIVSSNYTTGIFKVKANINANGAGWVKITTSTEDVCSPNSVITKNISINTTLGNIVPATNIIFNPAIPAHNVPSSYSVRAKLVSGATSAQWSTNNGKSFIYGNNSIVGGINYSYFPNTFQMPTSYDFLIKLKADCGTSQTALITTSGGFKKELEIDTLIDTKFDTTLNNFILYPNPTTEEKIFLENSSNSNENIEDLYLINLILRFFTRT